MSGARSRNKGARGERAVVAWLRQHGWPDARRYLAGDGLQPGDVDGFEPAITLEVKNHANYAIGEWVAQANAEAGPNRIGVVVMHPRGVALDDVGEWWAVLRFADFADLVRSEVTHSDGGGS